MALSLRASVDIRAPAERIFDLVCTPERLPEWNTSVERARRCVAGQAVCLGSRAVLSGRFLGQPLESETEVVNFEPPHLFATRSVRGPRVNTRIVLAALADGTRVQFDVSGEVPGGALGALVAEGFLRKELAASLERLRVIGEQPYTPA
jgi:uncharacterized membrane protein